MDRNALLQNSWSVDDTSLRLTEELRYALKNVPKDQLAKCLIKTPFHVCNGLGSRVTNVYNSAKKLIVSVDEFATDTYTDFQNKKLTSLVDAYKDLGLAVARSISSRSQDLSSKVSLWLKLIRTNPAEILPEVIGMTLGFLIGSGGLDANGGLPDLDLLAGIGAHRSILTHSILIGASAEAILVAIDEVVLLIYEHLPTGYDPIWDSLHAKFSLAMDSTNAGTGFGIAYHLGVDGTVQIATYKDLPFSVPIGTHQTLFAINAVTEGAYSAQSGNEIGKTNE
jgi:hypothetical protein